MPLVGEQSWSANLYNTGDNLYTGSWDLDFPPSAAYVKVFLANYYEFSDQAAADVGLMNIRFRNPNGIDETVTFPDLDNVSHVFADFRPTMTHVTYGMAVKGASAFLLWTLGYWG